MENVELTKQSLSYKTFIEGKCEPRDDLSIRYVGVIPLQLIKHLDLIDCA